MGTLNGSSPTANLAGANIKGNEASLHFPELVFAGSVENAAFCLVQQW